jgi:folate-binding protein YgfZ
MRQSILLPHHEARGARLAERPHGSGGSGGGPVALAFGDVPAEYRAGTEGCALFDDTDRGFLRVSGADAAPFLHGLLANDVRGLSAGRGNANLLLSAKGKVLFGFDVFAAEDLRLSCEPGEAERLAAALDMYHFSEDVTFEDATETHAPLSLAGPRAREVLAAVVGEVPDLGDHEHVETTRAGRPIAIASLEVAGAPGLSVDAGPDGAPELWDALVEAGATPAGLAARDILRVEAVRPAFGVDVSEDVYPQEALLEGAFSLDKGCYIGQEVVAKIDTYGGLNKRLHPLRVSHDDPVAAGTELALPDDPEERVLGVVTSWAYSFVLDTGLVLAYVKRKHQETGTVFALSGGGDARAEIVESPVRPVDAAPTVSS